MRGNRAEAERELAMMVEIVGRGSSVASRTLVGELIEQWFNVAWRTGHQPLFARPALCSTGSHQTRGASVWPLISTVMSRPRHGVPVAAIGRSGGRADSDPGSDVCGKRAQVDGVTGDHDGTGTGSCKGQVGVHDVGGR